MQEPSLLVVAFDVVWNGMLWHFRPWKIVAEPRVLPLAQAAFSELEPDLPKPDKRDLVNTLHGHLNKLCSRQAVAVSFPISVYLLLALSAKAIRHGNKPAGFRFSFRERRGLVIFGFIVAWTVSRIVAFTNTMVLSTSGGHKTDGSVG
jgi:hypothetical protein